MTTLFLSDVHLDPNREATTADFITTLAAFQGRCDALYILGDLLEYWLGDDQPPRQLTAALDAIAGFARAAPVYFTHGNRDFLVGADFADRFGCTLLPDAALVDLYGTPTLLMHGDTLCTDDVEYQKFRAMVRSPAWQQEFLDKPLEVREAMATQMRATSKDAVAVKAADIMDANADAVAQAFREYGVQHLIHGHTHRPQVHEHTIDGAICRRYVLGDWYNGVSYLTCDRDRWQLTH